MRATMSIDGLYDYDPTIFDGMIIPQIPEDAKRDYYIELTKAEIADLICLECFDLEVLYPNPSVMKKAITLWSKVESPKWQRMLDTLLTDYDPVYNVEEHIDETTALRNDHEDTTDNIAGTTTTTTQRQAVETEMKTVCFDSNDYEKNTKTIVTPVSGSSGGDTVSRTGDDQIKNIGAFRNDGELHRDRYGNIGVVSASKLVLEELETAKQSVYDYIVEAFKDRFCIVVY